MLYGPIWNHLRLYIDAYVENQTAQGLARIQVSRRPAAVSRDRMSGDAVSILRRLVVVPLVAGVMTTACGRHHTSPFVRDPSREVPACPPSPESPPTPLAAAARQLITKAVAGVFSRGEQDQMLRIEAKLPGFGGWYLADGEVVAYMKRSAPVDSALVRKTLYEEYAARAGGLRQEDHGTRGAR
jgi:hypothetical protein